MATFDKKDHFILTLCQCFVYMFSLSNISPNIFLKVSRCLVSILDYNKVSGYNDGLVFMLQYTPGNCGHVMVRVLFKSL